MNAPLSHALLGNLPDDVLLAIGQRVDLPAERAASAVVAALPLLFGGLAHVAKDPEGRRALLEVLDEEFRGTDPAMVARSALAGGSDTRGEGVLRHVFGERTAIAEQTLGAVENLGTDRARTLLRGLAPAVLSQVAERLFARGVDEGSSAPGDPTRLAGLLEAETEAMRAPDGFGAGLVSAVEDGADSAATTGLGEFTREGDAPLPVQTAEMRSPRPLL